MNLILPAVENISNILKWGILIYKVRWSNSITYLVQGNSGSSTGSTKDKLLPDFTACYNKTLTHTVSHCSNK